MISPVVYTGTILPYFTIFNTELPAIQAEHDQAIF
jgi:hypothetical protein